MVVCSYNFAKKRYPQPPYFPWPIHSTERGGSGAVVWLPNLHLIAPGCPCIRAAEPPNFWSQRAFGGARSESSSELQMVGFVLLATMFGLTERKHISGLSQP